MSIDLNRRRFTVDEYHRMGEAGILAEHEPVELIAGEIVVREPIGSRHAGTVNRLTRLWTSRLGDRAIVQIQNPIELPKEDSEPQPDVTVLRPRADFYTGAHPVTADVLLLIEVSDSTLAVDRRVRMPLYARAAIPEAWILDLTADRVEVYRAPTADGYERVVTLGRQRLLVLLVVGAAEADHLLVRGGARRDARQRLARDHGAGLPFHGHAARADVDPPRELPAHALDEHRQQRAGQVAEHEEECGEEHRRPRLPPREVPELDGEHLRRGSLGMLEEGRDDLGGLEDLAHPAGGRAREDVLDLEVLGVGEVNEELRGLVGEPDDAIAVLEVEGEERPPPHVVEGQRARVTGT